MVSILSLVDSHPEGWQASARYFKDKGNRFVTIGKMCRISISESQHNASGKRSPPLASPRVPSEHAKWPVGANCSKKGGVHGEIDDATSSTCTEEPSPQGMRSAAALKKGKIIGSLSRLARVKIDTSCKMGCTLRSHIRAQIVAVQKPPRSSPRTQGKNSNSENCRNSNCHA
ncbi:hypothetical protein DUNSADRAFT_7618 [Dunaliella salina]|uniref:Encoded protein n=1 Tax=Dunaliella salina TaxID=3046 RepID=A0ABQ7GL09_DUNSA|nr:hypothetical protein DUNSADRAFT_7618 [Dunaliella salina]|eukprot:KAF5835293.1 hypothetical protein DUNSADRAFT_7618 [Dunaliella salina]